MSKASDEHKSFDPSTDNHPDGGKYGCVWKHASSVKEGHPCHYPSSGVKAIRTHRDRYERDHRDRAVRFGYLVRNGDQYQIAGEGSLATPARGKAPDRAAKKGSRGESFSLAAFLEKFVNARARQPLDWLVREEEGWYVDHPHPDGATQPRLTGVRTFTLRRGRGHPGQKYPYLHEHHHIIPQDALNKFVLSPGGRTHMRDARIKVLLKAKWNINHESNMVVLPSEVVPARVVGLPAHCPWDEADHPRYTESLELWLNDARRVIDSKVNEKQHEIVAQAAEKMTKVSRDLLEVIFQMRGGTKLMATRRPAVARGEG